MRFMRMGRHLVNLFEVCYIHFGTGNHIDIVFNNRVLSGEVSDATMRRLECQSSEVGDLAPEKGLSGLDILQKRDEHVS